MFLLTRKKKKREWDDVISRSDAAKLERSAKPDTATTIEDVLPQALDKINLDSDSESEGISLPPFRNVTNC